MNPNTPGPTWPPSAHPDRNLLWTPTGTTQNGTFVTAEGPDCSGKSTLVKNLEARLIGEGYEVVVTREPGGPPRREGQSPTVAQLTRQMLVEPHTLGIVEKLSHETTLMLFWASRFAHMASTVIPALERGCVVLCDRFYGSTWAYQLHGLEMAFHHSPHAKNLYLAACAMLARQPDAYVYVSVPKDELARRRAARHGEQSHIDLAGPEFHDRVIAGYERFFALDGQPPEAGLERITETVSPRGGGEAVPRRIVADGTLGREPLADYIAERLQPFLS